MVFELFSSLTLALGSGPFIALSAAFIWGILSILLSPCHLASIPLIIGFINDQEEMTTRKAFILSLLFSVGILMTIALIGLITGLMGRMLGDIGNLGNYFVAAILFLVGLHLLGIIPLPFAGGIGRSNVNSRKGAFAAFMLGLIFGIALGPCTFAYLAPMLSIVFSLSSTQLWYGILLLMAYGTGHCIVIIFAGTFTESVEKYLHWNESSSGAVWVKKICGVLIMLAAMYFVLS